MITAHAEDGAQFNWADTIDFGYRAERGQGGDPWEKKSTPDKCARLSALLGCDRMSLLALHIIRDGYDENEIVHYSMGKRGRMHGINDIFIPGVGTYRNIEHKVFFRGLKRGGRG
ncbi:hypothetical protein [uncultured Gilvimarinus sp.]|uniref:hypothetical protein n=1 Tax=uncultured Gilvimarinus sp. TaxID=1689143 RepID=UPI0030EF2F6B|tara:strand:+ start:11302 stop:11646 length:345 start_codon:yes stop_codon:yes gene_type:complete